MSQPTLIIEGLTNLEFRTLEKELKDADVPYTDLSDDDAAKQEIGKQTGKAYELLSALIIGIGITNIALRIYKIWKDKRERPKTQKYILVLKDGTLVPLKNGEIEKPENLGDRLEEATDLLKEVAEVIKESVEP
ncbi:MAG TPA: hypothetical protein VNU70_10145 [Puia sp.]|jgi:hypothetical protein|nr:hypothetical protein [Puia sp.]